MENATKALLIAGAMLLAIMLLSLFVYVTRQMAESTSSIYDTLEANEIAEFNQQFLNYNGIDDLSSQDVATIINLAKDYNKSPLFTQANIEVLVNSVDYTGKSSEEVYNFIQTNLGNKYKCTSVSVNTSTLVVEKVQIEKITE